uniref:Uncharacterized protein n=1 Tax=Anopheles darlingi TaxID=43151 RepID=A0A2M4D7D4_ANODA
MFQRGLLYRIIALICIFFSFLLNTITAMNTVSHYHSINTGSLFHAILCFLSIFLIPPAHTYTSFAIVSLVYL